MMVVVQVPLIETVYALVDFYLVMPSQGVEFAHIDEFARRAVGLGGIPAQFALKAHLCHYLLSQLAYGEFLSRTHIDMAVAHLAASRGISVLEIDMEEHMHAGISHVLTP